MAWYKTGSISATNGSAVVYGAGTAWVDAGVLNAGDIITINGTLYEILSIQSNTQLTLASNYLGATAAGLSYAIMPIGLLPSALAQQVKTTLATANTALAAAVRSDVQNLTAAQQQTARNNIAALGAADVGAGRLVKSVAGGVDVVLTAAEAASQFLEFTGTLTANINVIVPAAVRLYYVVNGTVGAYALTVKTAGGAGVSVVQGKTQPLYCDGGVVRVAGEDAVALAIRQQQHRDDAVARFGELEAWRAGINSGSPAGGGTYAKAGGGYAELWFKVCGANDLGVVGNISYFVHISGDENYNSMTSTYIMTVLCSSYSGPNLLEGFHVRKLSGPGGDLFGHDGKDVYIRRWGLFNGGIFLHKIHAHGVGLTEYKTNLAEGDNYPESFAVAVTDAYSKGS